MKRKQIYLYLKVFNMKLVGSGILFVQILILSIITSMNKSNTFSNRYLAKRVSKLNGYGFRLNIKVMVHHMYTDVFA